jgi:NAD(P)-dependent dehydrogenase (short-subunit alcohol dehydrogenase family)
VDHFGRIDVVFNNAGIAGAQLPLHLLPVDDWQQVRGIDGDGIFYVMKYCIAEMLHTGGGVIVNTSSTAGLTGQQNISPYTFSKAGIIGLTRSAAIEYADRNIRVNAIAPTVVWTPLVERFAQTAPDPVAMRAAIDPHSPLPGIAQAQDVAAGVAFLASGDARRPGCAGGGRVRRRPGFRRSALDHRPHPAHRWRVLRPVMTHPHPPRRSARRASTRAIP